MPSIQVQSAEINNTMNLSRTNHSTISYYDNNNTEQRDELLRSLAQNPSMLNDFYQFLEFTRARSAQQLFQHPLQQPVQQSLQQPFQHPIQQPYNEQINQEQQQIPSILNIKTNFQNKSSTPKRSRPLNESSGSISSAPKLHKPSKTQREQTTTTNDQQRKSLPFDQLKRAVSSNLPCFYIDFDQSTTAQRLPSAFEARNFIEKHFKEHNIRIHHFSLVGWANKRLKLGVNNKEDYMTLV